jgi:HEAT repeat protein
MSMLFHARKSCARFAGRARVRVGVGVSAGLISLGVGAVAVLSQSQGKSVTVTNLAVTKTLDPNLKVDVSPGTGEVKSPVTQPTAELNLNQANVAEGSTVSTLFSKTSVLIVLALAGFGLLGVYRMGSHTLSSSETEQVVKTASQTPALPVDEIEIEPVRVDEENTMEEQASDSFVPAQTSNSDSAALYGAYRVDQEVGKLVLGQPHRLDVLGSRSPDDRHAIEVSLMKTLGDTDTPQDTKRRARQALEEYGFVARQCATLLTAGDAFNRVAAARVLGEIKSPIALPFLLEALYDNESGVRNQAIDSIGELKLPSAIGALLDLARRHPDVPSTLLSKSLSACSVEGLDFFDAQRSSGPLPPMPVKVATTAESRHRNAELPESLENEGLIRALANLKDHNSATRAQAIQDLGNYRSQISVQALVSIVRSGSISELRALAISSLGQINHHSVFPAVLIGMADPDREVRAAAARALSRLSFDRGDAYVRVIETAGAETIREVARACIQAGIVSQGIDRLASMDNRQAFEALSLVSLLARADMTDEVFDAISKHARLEVRVAAAKLLATTRDAKVLNRLRMTVLEAGIDEEVRTELLHHFSKAEEKSVAAEVVHSNGETSLEELRSSIYSIRESEIGKGKS